LHCIALTCVIYHHYPPPPPNHHHLHLHHLLSIHSSGVAAVTEQRHALAPLFAKKKKPDQDYKSKAPEQSKGQKQGQADRFDALTRQFMFTIQKLTKALPDGSKTILKNINLCFYPGAKIGVVGGNGSGKSSLLKIMAGVDTSFTGTAVPCPGMSVGYLPQEPVLEVRFLRMCVCEI
jgi:ABC-type uncharacterized transport system fused permease/ATPase subunit